MKSSTDLGPAVQALPRRDKIQLVQELIGELARAEDVAPIEYPIWSPFDAHPAAAALQKMLEQDKASTP